MANVDDDLLRAPHHMERSIHDRCNSSYDPLPTFVLPKGEDRHYQQQYADMYFARLACLKPVVEQHAAEDWKDFTIAGETARQVDRVLDVRQGQLCWVVGTCFMEMPLKPSVLDDISKEHWIVAPPSRTKYAQPDGPESQVMLEDESGRLRLAGGTIAGGLLVTGAIIAVLGTENADGDFEVVDFRVPDLPRQPQRWEKTDSAAALNGQSQPTSRPATGKVAIISGLGIGEQDGLTIGMDLLLEYLAGESTQQSDQTQTAKISRLIVAGNSLIRGSPIPSRDEFASLKKATASGSHKKFGYDSTSYNAAPTDALDTWLANLLPSLPVTLIPGESDPTSMSLPQPPIHPAMFPRSRNFIQPLESQQTSWLDCQTNPAEFDVDGFRFLGTGGQTVSDVYRYVAGNDRLQMMEAMLRWRLAAPTAPDTLWCYPFQDRDAFILQECPHVYFAGNQPNFDTRLIHGPVGQQVRLICVPKFCETGEVVVMNMDTLEPELVKLDLFEKE